MCNTKTRKLFAFLLSLAALILTAGGFLAVEHLLPTSHYAKVVEELPRLSDYYYHDFSKSLFYQGQPIALDRVTDTIYISHEITEDTTLQELLKPLRLTDNGYLMYFEVPDSFPPLTQCIRDNKAFRLIISNRRGIYMEYQVVFTPLPVISLDGHFAGSSDGDPNQDLYAGEMTLWTPLKTGDSTYAPEFSKAEWHLRGMTSATRPKQPLKLNLKKGSGKNRHLDLLGLGEEDDWLLNPMNMEDTKLRESLFSALWNQVSPLPMSQGTYLEAIIDGEYCGLYLLQRRVDEKYLDLHQGDILIKGISTYTPDCPENTYRVIFGQDTDIALMDPVYYLGDLSNVELSNFIDVNLFLLLTDATDNADYKNMFYLFRPEGSGYRLSFLPWDTDMTMGLYWGEDGFAYSYDTCTSSFPERRETEAVRRAFPQLDQATALRWQELRGGVFSEDHILDLLHSLEAPLDASGALLRDRQSWGSLNFGLDTTEAMESWILERLTVLDARLLETPDPLP